MNPQVELNLALILFLPWYAILGGLFCLYPRQPGGLARRAYDLGSLFAATLAAIAGTWWSYANADPAAGQMWRQVLATSVSYGMFLAVLTGAVLLRARLIRTGRFSRNSAGQ